MLSVPERHQRKIALGTLGMSEVGARIAGGPGHVESVKILRRFGMSDVNIRDELLKCGHDPEAIKRYMQS